MISSLSIVVPAYNEEFNVDHTVRAADAALRECAAKRLEWIIVDDGSTDGTWSEITGLADSISNVIPVKHPANRGLGAAVWTGMSQASSEWCTWMPADGQCPPQSFLDMVQLADDSDLILLMRHENKRGQWRRVLSLALYGWMRVMFAFDPYGFSGVYLVRKRLLRGMSLLSTTAVQNYAVAIHCRKNRCRIRQMPAAIHSRLSGKSKVANLPTMLRTLYDILKLRFVA
jgi:dolichol-phosphate mannosyltransferase